MKTVKRNRYYCDYCKKSGGQKAAMEKHEAGCTKNPNRKCGVCQMMQYVQQPIGELIAILPNVNDYKTTWDGAPVDVFCLDEQRLTADLAKVMPELRKRTDNCPACIMAALRQAKIPVPFSDLKFKEEIDAMWNEFWTLENEERNSMTSGYYG